MPLYENKALFGHDSTTGIVSVDLQKPATIVVYRRATDGITLASQEPLRPVVWLTEPVTFEGVTVESLAGEAPYAVLARCSDWVVFTAFRAYLRQQKIVNFTLVDPVQQYLMLTGRTLFKGLEFQDLRRMQVDIETYCDPDYEFPNAKRESDFIMAIACSDATGWEEFIVVDQDNPLAGEKAALLRLTELIQERDPDVLEGHNLFKFDLPYLHERARRHKLNLTWGRDGSRMTSRASRVQVAERTINYPRFEVHGRHIVDTFLLAQFYDVGSRELEGFGLKTVAKHFGLSGGGYQDLDHGGEGDSVMKHSAERVLLQGKGIQQAYQDDPAAFAEYALQDVRETRAIAELLSGSYFTQAQIFPYNYQNVIVRGNATKIDALFLREYLRCDRSLPSCPESRHFGGGYTDVFMTGVARPVWHCDVTSLYPSVMMQYKLFPKNDTLGVFAQMLGDLRNFRIDAKQRLKSLTAQPDSSPQQVAALNALQSTFKILINSFYGYLGFSQAHFGDFSAAEKVTETGRDLLKQMVAWLEAQQATIVEIDTDGVYFIPPPGVEVTTLDRGLAAELPKGIEVEFSTRYAAMFSYKAKNYALMTTCGELILKGAALKSRGIEKFQRDFLRAMIVHIIAGEPEKVHALRDEYAQHLQNQDWEVSEFMMKKRLQDSLVKYQTKISGGGRNRAAAYELALASGRDYQPGDQISYYITGEKRKVSAYENSKIASDWDPAARDENVAYYIGKLDDLVKKFAPFLQRDSAQDELF